MPTGKNVRALRFVLVLLLGAHAPGCATDIAPSPDDDPAAQLGIPPEAQHVLVLGQFSHMDWDWNVSFRQYLNAGIPGNHVSVTDVYDQACQFLGRDASMTPPYIYGSEVTGFLRAYLDELEQKSDPGIGKPCLAANFPTDVGDRLRLLGGGTTSPDNLVPHGESLLRNYLVGSLWADRTLGIDVSDTLWIPDDFGHDAQLPVVVEALGFRSAAFARLPGATGACGGLNGTPVNGSPADQFQNRNDFFWKAADGSTMFAHWMSGGYCQANGLSNLYGESEQDARSRVEDLISGYLSANVGRAATRYVFLPVGGDFSPPASIRYPSSTGGTATADLRDFAQWWNDDVHGKSSKQPDRDTYAIALGFDYYTDLILATKWAQHEAAAEPFYPTPYWTGFYASRPGLKILHQQATRSLLAAETLGLLADSVETDPANRRAAVAVREAALLRGWNTLTPSTHHDYVTGTAADNVHLNEQAPGLRDARAVGNALRDLAVQQIASSVRLDDVEDTDVLPVLVANPLGWARQEVVEVAGLALGDTTNATTAQQTDSGALFVAAGPGLGYCRNDFGSGANTNTCLAATPGVPVSVTCSGGTGTDSCTGAANITMQNGKLKVIISKVGAGTTNADWAITSLRSVNAGTPGPEIVPGGTSFNGLRFFEDFGGLYLFGNEDFNGDGPNGQLAPVTQTLTLADAQILEKGPLRATVRTVVSDGSREYIREYRLDLDAPHVLMRATGSAAADRTVGASFPMTAKAAKLEYGTPYHWDDAPPQAGWVNPPNWNEPVFQATHNFVIAHVAPPGGAPAPVFALYHQSLQAVSNNGRNNDLLAVLWRNTPTDDSRGQEGSDDGTYTHLYAVRVPDGLGNAASGQPLKEAMAIFSPLLATLVPSSSDDRLPKTRQLATLDGSALITAAKAGSRDPGALILRLYKPDNTLEPSVSITVDKGSLGGDDASVVSAQIVTALEKPVAGAAMPTGDPLSLSLSRALSTVSIDVKSN